MKTEIKPCPFCGGEAIVQFRAYYGANVTKAIISCISCPVEMVTERQHDNNDEIISGWTEKCLVEAWNRRVEEVAE